MQMTKETVWFQSDSNVINEPPQANEYDSMATAINVGLKWGSGISASLNAFDPPYKNKHLRNGFDNENS